MFEVELEVIEFESLLEYYLLYLNSFLL
jgi:hypothetical protein